STKAAKIEVFIPLHPLEHTDKFDREMKPLNCVYTYSNVVFEQLVGADRKNLFREKKRCSTPVQVTCNGLFLRINRHSFMHRRDPRQAKPRKQLSPSS
ncbi:MAG: hypothetical protein V7703_16115, partial [Hyphomicrobiales bacterium]